VKLAADMLDILEAFMHHRLKLITKECISESESICLPENPNPTSRVNESSAYTSATDFSDVFETFDHFGTRDDHDISTPSAMSELTTVTNSECPDATSRINESSV